MGNILHTAIQYRNFGDPAIMRVVRLPLSLKANSISMGRFHYDTVCVCINLETECTCICMYIDLSLFVTDIQGKLVT